MTTVRLTKPEVALLRWACEVAVESEHELISCYLDNRGRTRDVKVDRKCRQTIARLQKLRERLKTED